MELNYVELHNVETEFVVQFIPNIYTTPAKQSWNLLPEKD